MVEIVLPIGTRYITIGEIPGLIARAIHPNRPRDTPRVLSYLCRTTATGRNLPLQESDWSELSRIWAELPPVREGLIEFEWPQYMHAFVTAEQPPDWQPIPVWHNDVLNTEIAQVAAEEEFKQIVQQALEEGQLVARRRLTLQPELFALGEQLRRAVVALDDFVRWVGTQGLTVRVDAPERYTLEEAADAIGRATDERAALMRSKLMRAAGAGTLPTYEPGTNARYEHDTYPNGQPRVREWYEQAYWNDLNAWLDAYEPHVQWRYPQPCHLTGPTPASTTVQQQPVSEDGPSTRYDWPIAAREIAASLRPRHPKKNLDQVAELVREEMLRRHADGESGMTGRGNKVPSAGTIRREAMQNME